MTLWPFWAILAFCIVLGIFAVWYTIAEGAHWPDIDEDPTLDVQDHVGDSRPMR